MSLRWQASSTGSEYRIFRDKIIAGILKINFWKGDAYGELNGYMLRFKNVGFWNPGTVILDIEGTRTFGTISYNFWKNTAEIVYENETYQWRYDSWMMRKWQISRESESARYVATGFWKNKGEIENENLTPALILAGLFVHCNFVRRAAIVAS